MTTEDKLCYGAIAAFGIYVAARIWHDREYYSLDGVGAVKKQKRRVYAEIADLQEHTNVLTSGKKYWQLDSFAQNIVEKQAKQHGFTGSAKSNKSLGEQYFNSLKRAYNAVSGTTFRPEESVVYNENGDPIIIYRDYGTPEQKKRWAQDWFEQNMTDPYSRTILYIATGGKMLWSSSKKDGVKRGLKEQLFATATDAAGERKARISYLSKDGLTPEGLAHKMWESTYNMDGAEPYDTTEILNGVNEALLNITSVGQAQEYIMNMYVEAHTVPDGEDPENQLPF